MEASGKQDLWTRQPLQSAARYGPGSRAAPGTFGAGIWGGGRGGILHPLSIFQRACLRLIACTALCFLRASLAHSLSSTAPDPSLCAASFRVSPDGGTPSRSYFRLPRARTKLASLISQSRPPSFPLRSAVPRTRVGDGPHGPTWPGAGAALCSQGPLRICGCVFVSSRKSRVAEF